MCYQNKKRKRIYDASYLFIYTVRPQALRQTQHTNKREEKKTEEEFEVEEEKKMNKEKKTKEDS